MTVWVRAGLYAEGPSDDAFLLPLIQRVLAELLHAHYPAQHELEAAVRLDDSLPVSVGRARRIAAAIREYWSTCTLFVIHADGKSDPDRERAQFAAPGIALAREQWQADPETARLPLAVATCVPVREIEAWLLADAAVFERLGVRDAPLPPDPERVTDPKRPLNDLLKPLGLHRHPRFDFFGERVDLAALRRLPAFRAFEAELLAALHTLARPGRD